MVEGKDLKVKNVAALIGGFVFFIFLFFSGIYISTTIAPVQITEVRQVYFILAFVGISTGHYLGLAIKKETKRTIYFLVGLFGSLSFIAAFTYLVSIPTGILLFSAVLLFLLHYSEVIKENTAVEKWLTEISEKGSAMVLIIASGFYYLLPLLRFVLGF